MMNRGISLLAHVFDHLRDVTDRTAPIFGVAVHQTGTTIVKQAIQKKIDPLEYAVNFYLDPENYFAHYVIAHDGTIAQVANEQEKASHIGWPEDQHAAYLDGTWVDKLPKEVVAAWRAHWPNFKSPAHVFPGKSPNNVYVGIECLPVVPGCGFKAAQWLPSGLFTEAQHEAVAQLTMDIAERQGLPPGWHLSARLTTHEEINPLARTTKVPPAGWDPGWLRPQPWFDLGWVRLRVSDLLAEQVAVAL